MGVRCIIAIRQQCFGRPLAAVGVRFIAPVYTYSPRYGNPFRIHSRNVRNVFVICVLHIRRVKVWFLRAKVWFLACKKWVFALQKYGFCFLNVVLLQFVLNVMAIRQQHFGNPSAAVGSDLSCQRIYIRHPFFVCLVDIKSVLWQLCPLAKMVRLRWLCSVCLPVCRLFGYC